MKKLVIKKKKKIRVRKLKKLLTRVIASAATCCLLLGAAPTAPVQAAQETQGYIYHVHTGDEQNGGGCYTKPVYHEHTGSEAAGGDCYGEPVYHTHEGDESSGSGCYGEPVYHVHQGTAEEGGQCYKPVSHEHTSSCYRQGECRVDYSWSEFYETYDNWCYHHSTTQHAKVHAKARHSSCGAGTVNADIEICWSCQRFGPTTHNYSILSCTADLNEILGYRYTCTKTEEDVDYYTANCGKDSSTIDSYAMNCNKTGNTIDGYAVDCGWDDSMPYGVIHITNETPGQSESVTLRVSIEDLTGGRLQPEENPYTWYDAQGNEIGTEETVIVDKNGNYSVSITLKNDDVDKDKLKKDIHVTNVFVPKPNTNQDSSGRDNEDSDRTGTQTDGLSQATPTPTPTPTATPMATAVIQVIPELTQDTETSISIPKEESLEGGQTPSASPLATSDSSMLVETETVEIPEQEAIEEVPLEPIQIAQPEGSFTNPAVRVITATAGSLLILGGFLLLLLFLKGSVRLYNDDGEGRMIYLGRCIVKHSDEGMTVTITEAMNECACTNRYSIKPGLFMLGKSGEQELIICKGQTRISVYLGKEMIFII